MARFQTVLSRESLESSYRAYTTSQNVAHFVAHFASVERTSFSLLCRRLRPNPFSAGSGIRIVQHSPWMLVDTIVHHRRITVHFNSINLEVESVFKYLITLSEVETHPYVVIVTHKVSQRIRLLFNVLR